MGRRVKCRITGEYGDSNEFIKIDGKYYKNQEIYEKWKKEKDARKEVMDIICFRYLNYEPGQVFNTLLTKKLKALEFYGYEIILETLKKCEDSIQYAVDTIDFTNDVGKISYIMAIINNNINDVYANHKKAERDKLIKPVEVHLDETVNLDEIQTKHEEKDLRQWLEDDSDWL